MSEKTHMKIVVIGGVAGGASAAAKARRVNEQAEIVIFEKGPYVSFANCGLPYYIGGEIKDRQALLLQTPLSFWKRFRIKVHTLHEALRIDRIKKTIQVKNLSTGEIFYETYDKLILAPGAGALVPNVAGITSANIFTIKTVPDSDKVKNFIERMQPQKVVVVGAGFIGLEAAEVLKKKGLQVTMVETMPQVLPPLDEDMALFVSRYLQDEGLSLVLSDGLKAFHGEPYAREIELQSGRQLPMDLAILSIGVRPELQLAREAGLAIGPAGGIVVDSHQQTSDPDIYAAGAAVEVLHRVTGQKTRIPLAGPANKQGRVAGANAAGERLDFSGAVGTAIVECLGIVAAKTGLSEREAAKAGFEVEISVTHSFDHANYYPGGELLHLKLVVDKKSGRLLGAQVIGGKGVDKRIDVLATAISGGYRVTDLENLDLAYAPQFSSAKDPVVLAGFVASNIHRDDTQVITWENLSKRLADPDLQIVDVRTREEYEQGHIPEAQLIPIDELRDRLRELDPKKETILYCRVGLRGYLGARILKQNGFDTVSNLTGGILMSPTKGQANGTTSKLGQDASIVVFEQALKDKRVVALDVREKDEFEYEHIEKTTNVPLNALEEAVGTMNKDQEVFVICETGLRTAQAMHLLHAAGFANVHSVVGGIRAWKAAGFPVTKREGPIPIMRQVQIVAGSLALLGGLFPAMRWISILVGGGLIFAGVSGTCGMALLLALMPWNRRKKPQSDAKNACGPCSTG